MLLLFREQKAAVVVPIEVNIENDYHVLTNLPTTSRLNN